MESYRRDGPLRPGDRAGDTQFSRARDCLIDSAMAVNFFTYAAKVAVLVLQALDGWRQLYLHDGLDSSAALKQPLLTLKLPRRPP